LDYKGWNIYALNLFPHRIPCDRNSKLMKRKKRQRRDHKEGVKLERSKVGIKDKVLKAFL
jgi:hypothetical protein